ncbi:hypothetical protein LUZ60_009674 [Juncus effusus]|nr:hypothetical protein LUZ60_009674 [Juncus effusus]
MSKEAGTVSEMLSTLRDLLGPVVIAELGDAWQLPKHLQRLQNTLPKIRTLIDRAEWRRFQDRNVAILLTNLKQTAYDAEDLLDQFAYRYHHQKVERSNQTVNFWRDFLIDLWNWNALVLKDMQERLDHCAGELKEVINLLASDDLSYQYGKSVVTSATSSVLAETEVFGRESDLEKLAKLLKNPDVGSLHRERDSTKRVKRETVEVLPIVGIGGVGKTTLAQMIYKYASVQLKSEFPLKLWVSVSDVFDVMRITKEIVECANNGKGSDVTNLDFMQGALIEKVKEKRFLIVLDNLWNENIMEWEKFFAPLRYGLKGSVILVTTRSLKVAEIVGTMHPFSLEGLAREPYRKLFERCAFGSESSLKYPHLVPIARRIADGLKGSPLAAKTLGSLLNSNKNERHWRAIMTSEIWELPQRENDILPALKLSYLYLPAHLKQCFSFCSLFPKDYNLRKNFLIDMWVSQGFITPEDEKKQEDVGSVYLNELVMRSFFQQSPRDPYLYVIHDLMRDLAQSVSVGECFRLERRNYHQDIPDTVRHLSVCTETANLCKLKDLGSCKKLRSILILSSLALDVSPAIEFWCTRLGQLRCLKIEGSEVSKLPENIGELKQLRYLDIPYKGIRSFPENFYHLNYLQCLYLNEWEGLDPRDMVTPEAFSKLVNLRRVYPVDIVVTRMASLSRLPYLHDLHMFKVRSGDGYRICELESMNQLRGCLKIKDLENVETMEQAAQAKLYNKQYVNDLTLEWSRNDNVNDSVNTQHHSEVLQRLQPHSNLNKLQIKWYLGSTSPTWLNNQNLPCLSSLILYNCVNLREIICLPPSLTSLRFVNVGLQSLPRLWDHDDTNGLYNEGSGWIERSALSELCIENCPNIVSMEGWILHEHVPHIKSISIKNCASLTQLPPNCLLGRASLEEFIIENCPSLDYVYLTVLPSSLKTLELDFCARADVSFSDSLKYLTSLITLRIKNCNSNLELGQVLSDLTSLKSLSLRNCANLCSLSGLQALTLLENLRIFDCPKIANTTSANLRSQNVRGLSLPSLKCLIIDDPAFLIYLIGTIKDPLPTLFRLEIWNYEPPSMPLYEKNIKSIKQLAFSNCSNILDLPNSLVNLTSLETLSLNGCTRLRALPRVMPSSFKILQRMKCPNLVVHPERSRNLLDHRSMTFAEF